MWSNWLVGSITTLALALLLWPFMTSALRWLKAAILRAESRNGAPGADPRG
jgi:hypothetical protein